MTILLVEQMAAQALALADRAYVLEGGRITLEGAAAAVRRDPARDRGLSRPAVGRGPALKPSPGAPMILDAMPWPLRVARLGSVSLERLAATEDGHGRIHSVFDQAINILWHDGRLLTLLGCAHLAAPFAVALFELPPRDAVAPGSHIRRSDFDCTQSEAVALEMPRGPLAFHPARLPEPPCGHALATAPAFARSVRSPRASPRATSPPSRTPHGN